MPKVFLSAGHGGSDPGALGNGLKEKDINLQIMLACQEVLLHHGLTVVCSRTTDEYDPVQQEVREANASGADIAFSIHTNAGGGDGSESFYWKTSSKGKKLAELCEKHVKAIGQNSRGVKTNNLMFTRETTMPAVLSECAFIDTKKDIEAVNTVAEQKKFGVAYAKAILEFFGIKYVEEKKPEPQDSLPYMDDVEIVLHVLQSGSKGEQVETLQRLLNSLGYPCGDVDGIFGTKTKAALVMFQKGEKLEADGVVGKLTWGALLGV